MKTTDEKLILQLKNWIIKNGWTQVLTAKELGVSKITLNRWLKGRIATLHPLTRKSVEIFLLEKEPK